MHLAILMSIFTLGVIVWNIYDYYRKPKEEVGRWEKRYLNMFKQMDLPKNIKIYYCDTKSPIWDFKKKKIVPEINFFFRGNKKIVTTEQFNIKKERVTLEGLRRKIISKNCSLLVDSSDYFRPKPDAYFEINFCFLEKPSPEKFKRWKTSFMAKYLRNEVDAEVIDDEVEAWHNSPDSNISLAEYLGLTEIEFERWVAK